MGTLYLALRHRVHLAWALKATEPTEQSGLALPYDVVLGDTPRSTQFSLEAWDRLNYLTVALAIELHKEARVGGTEPCPTNWDQNTPYARDHDEKWLK